MLIFVLSISLLFMSLLLLIVLYHHFKLKRSYEALKIRLNDQTLDYHIKAIDELGYDISIKPKKKKSKR